MPWIHWILDNIVYCIVVEMLSKTTIKGVTDDNSSHNNNNYKRNMTFIETIKKGHCIACRSSSDTKLGQLCVLMDIVCWANSFCQIFDDNWRWKMIIIRYLDGFNTRNILSILWLYRRQPSTVGFRSISMIWLQKRK